MDPALSLSYGPVPDKMTVAVSILPEQQLAVLNAAYRQAVARRRWRLLLGAVVFAGALVLAAIGAEVNLRTLFTYFGNFVSYFDRILTLDSGQRVWTDIGEWMWGWQKWLKMLGETLLISYVGTLIGATLAFALNFFAADNLIEIKTIDRHEQRQAVVLG